MADRKSARVSRAEIVAEARSWTGTPYRHQASLKGAGCDCLGLIRGVYRVFCGPEKEPITPYSPNWAEETGQETLRDAAHRHLVEIDARPLRDGEPLREGDVILVRVRDRGPAKHAAIASGPDTIIHAYDRHAVAENALPAAWRRRIAYAFEFPGVMD
ncbi:MAG: Gene Transfer Agent NlpC/P60 family peptidase [Pseudolabrys sp.]|jgi:NlpC/P60 family putative phage cell wall peptidase|nr:Gene Transfer Agent NlpC/P60 family peptidase [Pseudolabrys sp.]